MTHRPRRIVRWLVLATLLATGSAPGVALAHDIPADVTVQAFVKPAGRTLQFLVRVPLTALREVEYPRRTDGSLDAAAADSVLRDAARLWIADTVEMFEGDERLPYPTVTAVMVALQGDSSFRTFAEAHQHVTGPRLPDRTAVDWNQGWLDTLFEYPIDSDQSRFAIRSGMDRLGLRVVTGLRFLPPNGPERAFEFEGGPGLIRLDPSWRQAALTFVRMGFVHILEGPDHLLFLFCLVIPFRRFGRLIPVVTAFTAAHSITLIASAYDLGPGALWFPPLIETLIAVSIVYMALENIVAVSPRRRWLITFGFGLVHGFGFSFALRQTLQFAGSHLLTSLLSFNLGVELGQILVLAVIVPALELLFRYVVAERMGTVILSAMAAHTGWHWTVERYDRFAQFRVTWPVVSAASSATVLRWLAAVVLVGGLVWLARLARPRAAKPDLPVRQPIE